MAPSHQYPDPWTLPLIKPPPGITSDFYKQSKLLDFTIGIGVAVFVLMTATLSLRFWTKYKRREALHLDDFFTILTFTLTIAVAILQYFVTVRFGFEAWDIPVGLMQTTWTHHILKAEVCMTTVMLFFGKCCILAFYLRVFGHMDKVRYQIYCAFLLASAVIAAGILVPVWARALWTAGSVLPLLRTAKLYIAIGTIKLVLDLVIVYIPIPIVLGMNLSRGKMLGVLATFLTGSIAIVADIVDLCFRVNVYKDKSPFINGVCICLCGLVEAAISVIVASMPAAAKAWKCHVMTSSLYKMIRSKPFQPRPQTIHTTPSDLRAAKAKAQKKRRWGLYSIPTLPTSHRTTTQTRWAGRAETSTAKKTEMTMVKEFRQSLELKFASLDVSSLDLRDPTGPHVGQSMV